MSAAAAALKVLEDYMAAFNARDADAFEATINHPHVSLGPGAPVVTGPGRPIPAWSATDHSSDWSHSTLDRRQVLHDSDDKVHIAARTTRHRRDGGVIGTYDVIYVITCEGGRWGMKALSGMPAT